MSADELVEGKSKKRRKRRDDEENDEVEAVEASEAEDRSITERKGRATPGKRNKEGATASDGNIITRPIGGVRGYFKGVSDEMRKVVWPDRDELKNLTWMVLATTIMSSIVLGILSLIFAKITDYGIGERHAEVYVIVFLAAGAGYYFIDRLISSGNSSH